MCELTSGGTAPAGTTGAATGHSDRRGCLPWSGLRVASNRIQVKLALIYFENNLFLAEKSVQSPQWRATTGEVN